MTNKIFLVLLFSVFIYDEALCLSYFVDKNWIPAFIFQLYSLLILFSIYNTVCALSKDLYRLNYDKKKKQSYVSHCGHKTYLNRKYQLYSILREGNYRKDFFVETGVEEYVKISQFVFLYKRKENYFNVCVPNQDMNQEQILEECIRYLDSL